LFSKPSKFNYISPTFCVDIKCQPHHKCNKKKCKLVKQVPVLKSPELTLNSSHIPNALIRVQIRKTITYCALESPELTLNSSHISRCNTKHCVRLSSAHLIFRWKKVYHLKSYWRHNFFALASISHIDFAYCYRNPFFNIL
jgi:hypothetical protein